ncbi:MAG: DUF4920 domain-containing protein [Bdellovibrionaceae bacterium]|nr:DUF4920 domain-containing protein [Pseudobdellovibrionaceae bacterium]
MVQLINILFTIFLAMGEEKKTYGSSDFAAPEVKLAQVLKEFSNYKDQKITMEGTVKQVCQEKGCWLKFEDQNLSIRTVMKNYGFTVPKDIRGKKIRITGVMEQKELPVKVVHHYMRDEGLSEEEIKKVNTPQKVFQFVADGIQQL